MSDIQQEYHRGAGSALMRAGKFTLNYAWRHKLETAFAAASVAASIAAPAALMPLGLYAGRITYKQFKRNNIALVSIFSATASALGVATPLIFGNPQYPSANDNPHKDAKQNMIEQIGKTQTNQTAQLKYSPTSMWTWHWPTITVPFTAEIKDRQGDFYSISFNGAEPEKCFIPSLPPKGYGSIAPSAKASCQPG